MKLSKKMAAMMLSLREKYHMDWETEGGDLVTLKALEKRGLVEHYLNGWNLTGKGVDVARGLDGTDD